MGDFKTHLKEVMRVVSCPICFERMLSEVVSCTNGHVICQSCSGNLTKCPTCQSSFSLEGHTFISQLLEVLPHPCEAEGCFEIMSNKSDIKEHEKLFCSHRITKCNVCSWSGTLRDLIKHVKTHGNSKGSCEISDKLYLCILDAYNESPPSLQLGFEDEQVSRVLISDYYGQLFWRHQVFDRKKEKLTFEFICVPNEKVKDSRFVIKLEFESNETKLIAETQLIKKPEKGTIEASLIFNSTMLMQLKKKDTLQYNFSIKKFEEQ